MLPDGSLSAEVADDKAIVISLKNNGLKLAALPNDYLHMLQEGLLVELRAREHCALNLINEYRLNNKQMFTEKSEALEAYKKIQAQNSQLAAMMVEPYQIVLELHIPEEVPLEEKIIKLAASVRDAEPEVVRVEFELNLKIKKLELKPQP